MWFDCLLFVHRFASNVRQSRPWRHNSDTSTSTGPERIHLWFKYIKAGQVSYILCYTGCCRRIESNWMNGIIRDGVSVTVWLILSRRTVCTHALTRIMLPFLLILFFSHFYFSSIRLWLTNPSITNQITMINVAFWKPMCDFCLFWKRLRSGNGPTKSDGGPSGAA